MYVKRIAIGFACLFISALSAFAQIGTITGRIVNSDTKAPITGATIFLSNSSYGTASSSDGTFTLPGVKPGQYSLVASIIGYQSYSATVLVNDAPLKLTLELRPKAIELKEVAVRPMSAADRKLYFEKFRLEFIGQDKEAKDCKIINPEVINFDYDKASNVFSAYTDDFLIVENRALGYKLKVLVNEFKQDGKTGIITYSGKPVFDELPGPVSQKKKWLDRRDEAYYGSPMHFFQSLYKDILTAQGFEMYHFTRQLNPDYGSGKAVTTITQHATMKEFSTAPLYINQKLDKKQWKSADVLRATAEPGLYGIIFPDILYVVYTKKKENSYFSNFFRPGDMPLYESSIVTPPEKSDFVLFDRNGTIVSESPLYQGTWSKARISKLLPVNYVPNKR